MPEVGQCLISADPAQFLSDRIFNFLLICSLSPVLFVVWIGVIGGTLTHYLYTSRYACSMICISLHVLNIQIFYLYVPFLYIFDNREAQSY